MAIEKDTLIEIIKKELKNKDSEIRKAVEEIVAEQIKAKVNRHRGVGRNHYGLGLKCQ